MTSPLSSAPFDIVGGQFIPIAGAAQVSRNPARPAETVWSGSPRLAHVNQAVLAAHRALPAWSALPIDRREAVLRRFQQQAAAHQGQLASVLCDEVGKVLWEARQEASLLAAKVDITLDASPESGRRRVTPLTLGLTKTREGRCLFRPHGVMAVIGPFNFPVHLAAGHIVPALLMGNTVVLKPSDKAPASGQLLATLFHTALRDELGESASAGVLNLVHGGADIASALVNHDHVDAIAFTGSWPVGRRLLEANLDRPGRIVALEMGGSNPAIVMPDADLRQAAIEIVRCAFNTCGQRCTSTRRAIIHEAVAPRLIAAIGKAASNLIIGDPRAAHPVFMGPIITDQAREAVFSFQRRAAATGGDVIVPSTPIDIPGGGCPGGRFLTPSVIRVGRFEPPPTPCSSAGGPASEPGAADDVEIFGPLLRISTARSLDDAIDQANATRFGLAASLFTRDQAAIDHFLLRCRAGCLNINTGTAGASSKLPFGGLGASGNHRPAGSFALDYCAYPVAAMVEQSDAAVIAEGMRFETDWI